MLAILDRDGVINFDSPDYIKSPAEWRPIPGSLEAIARLNRNGWRVAVASNQSGLARGLFSRADLDAIHARMDVALAAVGGRIDLKVYCPHGPGDGCECRKPAPGLLREIGRRLDTVLAGVPVIGDTVKDIKAARAVGARPLLVRTGQGEAALATVGIGSVETFADLSAAVECLLAEQG